MTTETRKLAAILAADVVGFSRLAGADEDRTLARLRALRSDLIDPTIAVHKGRMVKRTGDGAIVEFRSVVDAVRCAIEVQNAMAERNSGVSGRPAHRIPHRRPSRRRRRGGGRGPDGRRRQYRRAPRRRSQARRDLPLGGRLSAGQVAARSECPRSRCGDAEKHRRTGAGLFGRGRQASHNAQAEGGIERPAHPCRGRTCGAASPSGARGPGI